MIHFHFIPCYLHHSKTSGTAVLLYFIIKTRLMFITTPRRKVFHHLCQLFFFHMKCNIKNSSLHARCKQHLNNYMLMRSVLWEKVELKALNNPDINLCCRPKKASDLDSPTFTPDFIRSVVKSRHNQAVMTWASILPYKQVKIKL